eukprot:TRINITY_DN14307_c0_g1_i6.p1 TRINITY_DN14307_c0_g1~~TRINITY_DN14307_c0_g1_i6.p1  ORF type:complete len:1561 (-),score=345.68 TRINITY_DN14307_c0_g1_i6:482-5164(-)
MSGGGLLHAPTVDSGLLSPAGSSHYAGVVTGALFGEATPTEPVVISPASHSSRPIGSITGALFSNPFREHGRAGATAISSRHRLGSPASALEGAWSANVPPAAEAPQLGAALQETVVTSPVGSSSSRALGSGGATMFSIPMREQGRTGLSSAVTSRKRSVSPVSWQQQNQDVAPAWPANLVRGLQGASSSIPSQRYLVETSRTTDIAASSFFAAHRHRTPSPISRLEVGSGMTRHADRETSLLPKALTRSRHFGSLQTSWLVKNCFAGWRSLLRLRVGVLEKQVHAGDSQEESELRMCIQLKLEKISELELRIKELELRNVDEHQRFQQQLQQSRELVVSKQDIIRKLEQQRETFDLARASQRALGQRVRSRYIEGAFRMEAGFLLRLVLGAWCAAARLALSRRALEEELSRELGGVEAESHTRIRDIEAQSNQRVLEMEHDWRQQLEDADADTRRQLEAVEKRHRRQVELLEEEWQQKLDSYQAELEHEQSSNHKRFSRQQERHREITKTRAFSTAEAYSYSHRYAWLASAWTRWLRACHYGRVEVMTDTWEKRLVSDSQAFTKELQAKLAAQREELEQELTLQLEKQEARDASQRDMLESDWENRLASEKAASEHKHRLRCNMMEEAFEERLRTESAVLEADFQAKLASSLRSNDKKWELRLQTERITLEKELRAKFRDELEKFEQDSESRRMQELRDCQQSAELSLRTVRTKLENDCEDKLQREQDNFQIELSDRLRLQKATLEEEFAYKLKEVELSLEVRLKHAQERHHETERQLKSRLHQAEQEAEREVRLANEKLAVETATRHAEAQMARAEQENITCRLRIVETDLTQKLRRLSERCVRHGLAAAVNARTQRELRFVTRMLSMWRLWAAALRLHRRLDIASERALVVASRESWNKLISVMVENWRLDARMTRWARGRRQRNQLQIGRWFNSLDEVLRLSTLHRLFEVWRSSSRTRRVRRTLVQLTRRNVCVLADRALPAHFERADVLLLCVALLQWRETAVEARHLRRELLASSRFATVRERSVTSRQHLARRAYYWQARLRLYAVFTAWRHRRYESGAMEHSRQLHTVMATLRDRAVQVVTSRRDPRLLLERIVVAWRKLLAELHEERAHSRSRAYGWELASERTERQDLENFLWLKGLVNRWRSFASGAAHARAVEHLRRSARSGAGLHRIDALVGAISERRAHTVLWEAFARWGLLVETSRLTHNRLAAWSPARPVVPAYTVYRTVSPVYQSGPPLVSPPVVVSSPRTPTLGTPLPSVAVLPAAIRTAPAVATGLSSLRRERLQRAHLYAWRNIVSSPVVSTPACPQVVISPSPQATWGSPGTGPSPSAVSTPWIMLPSAGRPGQFAVSPVVSPVGTQQRLVAEPFGAAGVRVPAKGQQIPVLVEAVDSGATASRGLSAAVKSPRSPKPPMRSPRDHVVRALSFARESLPLEPVAAPPSHAVQMPLRPGQRGDECSAPAGSKDHPDQSDYGVDSSRLRAGLSAALSSSPSAAAAAHQLCCEGEDGRLKLKEKKSPPKLRWDHRWKREVALEEALPGTPDSQDGFRQLTLF